MIHIDIQNDYYGASFTADSLEYDRDTDTLHIGTTENVMCINNLSTKWTKVCTNFETIYINYENHTTIMIF